MALSEKEIIILDMIHTIQGLNSRVDFQVPLNESAKFFLKSSGIYYELKKEFGKQFTNLTEKDIYEDTFEKRVKSLVDLISDLEFRVRRTIPLSVDYNSEYNFQAEKIINEGVNELIECLRGIYFKRTDKEIYLYSLNKKKRPKLIENLIDLGKARLKFDLINRAKEEIIINGQFNLLEFQKVADACRYFVGDSKSVNKDELRSFVESLRFCDENDNLLDKKNIKLRINSWIQSQEGKPNNKIEFYAQENSSRK